MAWWRRWRRWRRPTAPPRHHAYVPAHAVGSRYVWEGVPLMATVFSWPGPEGPGPRVASLLCQN